MDPDGLRPGQTVSIGRPLDANDLHADLGMVVRCRKKPWGHGADVTRPPGSDSGWSPTWLPAASLYEVDDATYQAWTVNSVHTRSALGWAEPGTSTWQQRHEQRQLDRAISIIAAHQVLTERWQANGILPAPDEHLVAPEILDGEPNLFDLDLPPAA